MLRRRILRPWWLTCALIVWVAIWLALPVPTSGAPLPPVRAEDGGPPPAAGLSPDLDTAVRAALAAQGVAPADADRVIARLTPAERAELAERAAELGAGGNGALLIIVLIVVVAILLYLPMAGRMQGWW